MAKPPPLVIGLLVGLWLTPASAIDLLPTDGIAPLPGHTAVQLSYVTSRRAGYYRHGDELDSQAKLRMDQVQLRIGHSFEVADWPAYVYAQGVERDTAPGGHLSGLDNGTGLGDLTLVAALWPYADRTAGRYLGLAGYLILPTGDYDPARTLQLNVNPGENRLQWALQAGYSSNLSDGWGLMTAIDAQWFGDNDAWLGRDGRQVTQAQQVLWTWQTALTYTVAKPLTLGLTYYFQEGAATRLAGARWDNEMRVHRYTASAILWLPFGRLVLQYGGDLQTENGLFEEERVAVRFMKVF
jgi:hypothetical protein